MSATDKQLSPAGSRTRHARLLSATLLAAVLAGCCTNSTGPVGKGTCSSFDGTTRRTASPEFAVGVIDLQSADLEQVLSLYQEISGRTVIHGILPRPAITVRNQIPLTRVQALQLFDTVLSENGIAMVLAGDNAVKAVPQAMAATESPPEITLPWEMLPDSGSFMMRTVQLKKVRPSELIPVLMPFVKAPNALIPIDSSSQLIIRDYSSNVRQMLKLIQELETGTKP